jgi:hypothetical protein
MRTHGEASLRAILDNPKYYHPPKPVVIEGTNRSDNVKEALKALAIDGSIFHRGHLLVTLHDGHISQLPAEVLPERVSAAVQWTHQQKDGCLIERQLDMGICRNIAKRGTFDGIRPIRGVVNYPILRPDGSIHQVHGYDSETGYWLESHERWNVPPASDLEKLLEPLAEFPFADIRHQSAFIACLITMTTRHLIPGNVPAFAIDASRRGTGKGLLSKIAATICTGRDEFPTMTLSTDEGELVKELVSMAIHGAGELYFDNIEGPIHSAALCTLITTGAFTGRILGTSTNTAGMDWRPVVLFNGNNLDFRSDIARRVVLIRMVPDCERPEQRTFSITDLPGYVRDNRKTLLENLLAIARGYLLAGRPAIQTAPYGSFEGWSSFVCAAVIYAGLPDPNTNSDVQETTQDSQEIGITQLVAWLSNNRRPWTAKELIQVAGNKGNIELKEALCELSGDAEHKMPSAQRLGQLLNRNKQRVINGRMLDFKQDRDKVRHWYLRECGIVRNTQVDVAKGNPISKPISPQIGNEIGTHREKGLNPSPHYSAGGFSDGCLACSRPVSGIGWNGCCSVKCAADLARCKGGAL